MEKEFTCDDGACIPIFKRCDEISDCKDSSDENGCKPISVDPDKYRKEKPPIASNGQRTPISEKITIFTLSSFEELQMTFKAHVKIALTWYDNRLEFVNLKNDKKRGNMIGLEESKEVNSVTISVTGMFGGVVLKLSNYDLSKHHYQNKLTRPQQA